MLKQGDWDKTIFMIFIKEAKVRFPVLLFSCKKNTNKTRKLEKQIVALEKNVSKSNQIWALVNFLLKKMQVDLKNVCRIKKVRILFDFGSNKYMVVTANYTKK